MIQQESLEEVLRSIECLSEIERQTVDVLLTQDNLLVTNLLEIHYNGLKEKPLIRVKTPPDFNHGPVLELKQRVNKQISEFRFAYNETPSFDEIFRYDHHIVLGTFALSSIGFASLCAYPLYNVQVQSELSSYFQVLLYVPAIITGLALGSLVVDGVARWLSSNLRIQRAANHLYSKRIENSLRLVDSSEFVEFSDDETLKENPGQVFYESIKVMADRLKINHMPITAKETWQRANAYTKGAELG